jgi:hypothetical protein
MIPYKRLMVNGINDSLYFNESPEILFEAS